MRGYRDWACLHPYTDHILYNDPKRLAKHSLVKSNQLSNDKVLTLELGRACKLGASPETQLPSPTTDRHVRRYGSSAPGLALSRAVISEAKELGTVRGIPNHAISVADPPLSSLTLA